MSHALPGENIRVRLKGVEEEQVSKGWVLCPLKEPRAPCTRFKAQARSGKIDVRRERNPVKNRVEGYEGV